MVHPPKMYKKRFKCKYQYYMQYTHSYAQICRVTWDMTAPGGKTVPPPVDKLKLPRTSTEYTECCYHLPDTCFERSTPRSRRTLKYSIFNIYRLLLDNEHVRQDGPLGLGQDGPGPSCPRSCPSFSHPGVRRFFLVLFK